MRTTVNLTDQLLERAKTRARSDGRTLGEVIDDSLRLYLADRPAASGPAIPTFTGGGGFRAGVDPTSNASLAAAAEDAAR